MKKSEKKQQMPLPENVPAVKDDLEHIPVELRTMIADDVKRFVDILGINHYNVRIFYSKEMGGENYETFQGSVIGATTSVDSRYLTADIRIYPFFVDQWKKGGMTNNDMHEMIAHEVSHIVTDGLRKLAISPFKTEEDVRDSWESLTTIIGRLLNKIDHKKDIHSGDLTKSK